MMRGREGERERETETERERERDRERETERERCLYISRPQVACWGMRLQMCWSVANIKISSWGAISIALWSH